jgi:hypothetical protein
LLLVVLGTLKIQGQPSLFSLGPWHMRIISGEIDLQGHYRQLKSNINETLEDQRSMYLLSGIKLNTNSYLWDPDIVMLDINGAYSPELRDEKYIALPDRSEVRTMNKIDLRATVFNNKPITLSGFFNSDQNYFNRELLTNVRTETRQYGGMLSTNNRILPLSLSYGNTLWDQEELQTGRLFNMEQDNFQARATKSFGSRDRHELIYAHNDYLYRYAELYQTHHIIDRAALNNNIYFDAARKYNFNSRLTWYKQEGSTEFSRMEAIESFIFDLPANLRFNSNLNLYTMTDPYQDWDKIRFRNSLRHKLFLSLTSRIFFDYGKIRQTTESVHRETDVRGGIDIHYTKKIPTDGYINLTYRYFRHHHDAEGPTGILQVLDEEVTLSDGEISLLKRPYVDIGSIMLTDVTGGIVYQRDFDYLLIERNNYIEIQRIPGGQIPNNSSVYVDYLFVQPGTYEYTASQNQFGASILLFKRLLEFFYRLSIQDYPEVIQGDLLTLNYFTQHVYGARLDVGFARAGIEFDHFDSNIIPYKMKRYFVEMNWNYKTRLLINLNGNLRDYRMIADDVDHLYTNVSGRIAYRIKPNITLSLESGYLNQRGLNIDLDLLTARAEFHSVFRKLHLRMGVEMYRRMYLESDFAFNGAFIRITRKF